MAYSVGGLRKILVDYALDLPVRLETRWHDISVGDGLEQQPEESRVLRAERQARIQQKQVMGDVLFRSSRVRAGSEEARKTYARPMLGALTKMASSLVWQDGREIDLPPPPAFFCTYVTTLWACQRARQKRATILTLHVEYAPHLLLVDVLRPDVGQFEHARAESFSRHSTAPPRSVSQPVHLGRVLGFRIGGVRDLS